MKISRRDFLKWSVAAGAALKLNLDFDRINSVLAVETDPPVIWLQGAGCSGCTVSMLNVTNPTTIDDVLLNKISLKFDTTVATPSGESAMQALENAATQYNGQFILVIEGAIPTGASGNYCVLGELNGVPMTMQQAVLKYGPMAKYVVAAGSCASFGGIAAALPNSTVNTKVSTILSSKTTNPVVNLSGCPVHPTILIQTLLNLILTGMPNLDNNGRPSSYYSGAIHQSCPRRGTTQTAPGGSGCLKGYGCQGPGTKSSCPSMKWNNGSYFCITSGFPCIGCTEPTFPTNPLAY